MVIVKDLEGNFCYQTEV